MHYAPITNEFVVIPRVEIGVSWFLPVTGNRWFVFTSSPEAAEELFRAEGKYPSRGQSEENVEWLHRKLKYSSPMFFA